MKVALVTGAHGFLGRHVSLELARHGYHVHGLGHGSWTDSHPSEWGLQNWVSRDVDMAALLSLDVTPRLIVHCAGGSAVGLAEQNPTADFVRTVGSTSAVLECQKTRWPGAHLVLASSAAVYGNAQEQPLREEVALAPVSIYGLHKRLAEQVVQFYAERFGLAASTVRLFSVFGQGLRKQLFWDACVKLSEGHASFPGSGEETRDWVHVSDAAALLRMAGEREGSQYLVLNGGTGTGRRVGAVLDLIARSVAPATTLRFTGEHRKGDPQHYKAEIGLARALGWQPQQDFEAALAEYCAWFLQSGRA